MMECGMDQHQHVIVSKVTANSMHKKGILFIVMYVSCYTAEELMNVQ